MRHFGFPQSLAALGSMVAGLWLGQIGLALAQTNNPEQWACYPPHPKWGLYPNPLTSAPDQEQQATNPIAPQSHSDPTSTQHPDWDGLPAEKSWPPQNEVAESKESSAILTSTPETEESSETHLKQEEHSVCLSETYDPLAETQHAQSSYTYEDEVQSMEEYFQRYGHTYAGSERNNQIESRTTSSDVSADQTNTAAIETQEELPDAHDESGETSVETPEAESDASAKKSDDKEDDQKEGKPEQEEDWNVAEESETSEHAEEAGCPEEDTFPVEKEDISSEQPESDGSENKERMDSNPSEDRKESSQQEDREDLPQKQAEPAASPEDQNRDGSSETQDSSSEAFSPWGYEPGYERVEAEYTPPSEPGTTSQTEQNRNLSENTSPSEGSAEQKHLSPPADSLPHRYEYPEQQGPDGEEGGSSLTTRPLDPPEAGPSHEDSYPRNEAAPVGPDSPDSSEQDHRGQLNENESSWSDIPAQEPYPSNPSVNQPETSQYEWWLENPDTWSETTSPQTPDASDLPSSAGQPNASSPSNHQEEDLKGWKAFDGEGDSIPSETDVIENHREDSAGLESEAAPESGASLSPAAERSTSAHPSLLEGLGRSLLHLLEPWRKTVSGLLDISGAVEGVTKTFSTGEEMPHQQGAAALPAETMAR